jgi:hypothetical protein
MPLSPTLASGKASRTKANLPFAVSNLTSMRAKFWMVRIPDDIWVPFWEGALTLVVAISAAGYLPADHAGLL